MEVFVSFFILFRVMMNGVLWFLRRLMDFIVCGFSLCMIFIIRMVRLYREDFRDRRLLLIL